MLLSVACIIGFCVVWWYATKRRWMLGWWITTTVLGMVGMGFVLNLTDVRFAGDSIDLMLWAIFSQVMCAVVVGVVFWKWWLPKKQEFGKKQMHEEPHKAESRGHGMKWCLFTSKGQGMKWYLFTVCFFPILCLGVILFWPGQAGTIVGYGKWYLAVGLVVLLIHLWMRCDFTQEKKVMWTVLIPVFGLIALPVYWVKHVIAQPGK
jgi:hypothetical protein